MSAVGGVGSVSVWLSTVDSSIGEVATQRREEVEEVVCEGCNFFLSRGNGGVKKDGRNWYLIVIISRHCRCSALAGSRGREVETARRLSARNFLFFLFSLIRGFSSLSAVEQGWTSSSLSAGGCRDGKSRADEGK